MWSLSACNLTDGKGDCDLYEIKGYGTTSPVSVNIGAVNTSLWESSPMISSNGRTLVFARESKAVYNTSPENGTDIFISRIDEHGEWSSAVEIG